ncbi:MAG: metal-dependent hydrolase [Methanoregula sp.]
MYFFFHLLTGLIFGFLISDLLDDRRWLIPCTVGAILPDLIDKPIGYLLFPTTIGYGRIYSHTLLAAILVMACGLVIWQLKKDPGVMGVGVGIFSHQILDQMWLQPQNWYYPLLGPFKGVGNNDYFFFMLVQELKNPFELVLALILGAGALLFFYRQEIINVINRNRPFIFLAAKVCALLLCILSGIIIGWGISQHSLSEIGWNKPGELITGGMVIALSAGLVWRWQTRISKE